jgi:probable F420-dependent oxidoreductase
MPADSYSCVYDPIESLTFIAAKTARILLGTSAINALYHPPVLLARRLATLDQLSRGRLIAGVTSGWMEEEFDVAGVPKDRMGDGFNDHLGATRAVWGPDPVSYEGTHYSIPASDIGPKPRQSGGIPLVIGYTSEAGIRRAARIGDGLHPYRNDFDQLATELELWREALEREGRDPATLPVVLRAAATFDDRGTSSDGPLFSGDVSRSAEDLARLEAIGIDHVFVQFKPNVSVDESLDLLASLREACS